MSGFAILNAIGRTRLSRTDLENLSSGVPFSGGNIAATGRIGNLVRSQHRLPIGDRKEQIEGGCAAVTGDDLHQ